MKDQKSDQENKRDPFDGEYIGNMWGWRNSYIALAFLLFMMLLAALNYDPDKKISPEDVQPIQVIPDTMPQSPKQ